MTVARTFELITDCLVCMGFFFLWFGLYLVFTGVFMFCRFMCVSGEPASNPPRFFSLCGVVGICFAPGCSVLRGVGAEVVCPLEARHGFFLRFRRVVSGAGVKQEAATR